VLAYQKVLLEAAEVTEAVENFVTFGGLFVLISYFQTGRPEIYMENCQFWTRK
jgi:hypothetical protein